MRIIGIIVIVVAIALLGTGGYFLYRSITSSKNDNTNAANTNAVFTNTTTPAATPVVLQGDITVDRSVTYKGLTFAVDTGLRAQSFRREQAAEGSEFIVLFLKPFATDPPADMSTWSQSDIHLTTAAGVRVKPKAVELPKKAGIGGGNLVFLVPTGAAGLELRFGPANAEVSTELGF